VAVVQCTAFIRTGLARAGLSVATLLREFKKWKEAGDAGEFDFRMFGKDAAYDRPRIDGKRALRHVHLEPIDDRAALARWVRVHRFRGRKSSDRALVYAQSGKGAFLLIAILPEPDAHAIARMRTATHRSLMEAYAGVAREWLETGTITK
jgi:mRNA interferase YafO